MEVRGELEFTIIEQTSDQVIGVMPIRPGMLNPYGIVNAGAILWFADVCASVLIMGGKTFEPGTAGFPLAISLNAALVGNQKEGVFKATSRFVKRGRQLSVIRTTVTGANDRVIADLTTSHVASA